MVITKVNNKWVEKDNTLTNESNVFRNKKETELTEQYRETKIPFTIKSEDFDISNLFDIDKDNKKWKLKDEYKDVYELIYDNEGKLDYIKQKDKSYNKIYKIQNSNKYVEKDNYTPEIIDYDNKGLLQKQEKYDVYTKEYDKKDNYLYEEKEPYLKELREWFNDNINNQELKKKVIKDVYYEFYNKDYNNNTTSYRNKVYNKIEFEKDDNKNIIKDIERDKYLSNKYETNSYTNKNELDYIKSNKEYENNNLKNVKEYKPYDKRIIENENYYESYKDIMPYKEIEYNTEYNQPVKEKYYEPYLKSIIENNNTKTYVYSYQVNNEIIHSITPLSKDRLEILSKIIEYNKKNATYKKLVNNYDNENNNKSSNNDIKKKSDIEDNKNDNSKNPFQPSISDYFNMNNPMSIDYTKTGVIPIFDSYNNVNKNNKIIGYIDLNKGYSYATPEGTYIDKNSFDNIVKNISKEQKFSEYTPYYNPNNDYVKIKINNNEINLFKKPNVVLNEIKNNFFNKSLKDNAKEFYKAGKDIVKREVENLDESNKALKYYTYYEPLSKKMPKNEYGEYHNENFNIGYKEAKDFDKNKALQGVTTIGTLVGLGLLGAVTPKIANVVSKGITTKMVYDTYNNPTHENVLTTTGFMLLEKMSNNKAKEVEKVLSQPKVVNEKTLFSKDLKNFDYKIGDNTKVSHTYQEPKIMVNKGIAKNYNEISIINPETEKITTYINKKLGKNDYLVVINQNKDVYELNIYKNGKEFYYTNGVNKVKEFNKETINSKVFETEKNKLNSINKRQAEKDVIKANKKEVQQYQLKEVKDNLYELSNEYKNTNINSVSDINIKAKVSKNPETIINIKPKYNKKSNEFDINLEQDYANYPNNKKYQDKSIYNDVEIQFTKNNIEYKQRKPIITEVDNYNLKYELNKKNPIMNKGKISKTKKSFDPANLKFEYPYNVNTPLYKEKIGKQLSQKELELLRKIYNKDKIINKKVDVKKGDVISVYEKLPENKVEIFQKYDAEILGKRYKNKLKKDKININNNNYNNQKPLQLDYVDNRLKTNLLQYDEPIPKKVKRNITTDPMDKIKDVKTNVKTETNANVKENINNKSKTKLKQKPKKETKQKEQNYISYVNYNYIDDMSNTIINNNENLINDNINKILKTDQIKIDTNKKTPIVYIDKNTYKNNFSNIIDKINNNSLSNNNNNIFKKDFDYKYNYKKDNKYNNKLENNQKNKQEQEQRLNQNNEIIQKEKLEQKLREKLEQKLREKLIQKLQQILITQKVKNPPNKIKIKFVKNLIKIPNITTELNPNITTTLLTTKGVKNIKNKHKKIKDNKIKIKTKTYQDPAYRLTGKNKYSQLINKILRKNLGNLYN